MELIKLENISPTILQVAYNEQTGESYELDPYAISQFTSDIANLFLEQCAGQVAVFVPETIPRIPGEEEVWVANNTGNPAHKTTITISKWDKSLGSYVKVEEPSEVVTPHTLAFKYNPGQIVDEVRHRVFNQPPRYVKLPPYTRRPIPRSVAYAWFASQVFNDPGGQGALIETRPPEEFEARETWDLNRLCVYGSMLEREFMPALRIKCTYEYPVTVNVNEKRAQAQEQEADRQKAWEHIYFMLIDQRRNLPGKRAFETRMSAWEAEWNEKLKRAQDAFGKPKK